MEHPRSLGLWHGGNRWGETAELEAEAERNKSVDTMRCPRMNSVYGWWIWPERCFLDQGQGRLLLSIAGDLPQMNGAAVAGLAAMLPRISWSWTTGVATATYAALLCNWSVYVGALRHSPPSIDASRYGAVCDEGTDVLVLFGTDVSRLSWQLGWAQMNKLKFV